MLLKFRQRIFLEFDNIFEYEKYMKRYSQQGYKIIETGIDKNFWFEVEKNEINLR